MPWKTLLLGFYLLRDEFSIEILYKPSILDNITKLCIFYNDQHLLKFMASANVFKYAAIDEEDHEQTLQDETSASKGNLIPKGVVSLEILYDLQKCFREPMNSKTHISMFSHEKVNLGTEKYLKFVNLGTCCTPQECKTFIHLFKHYCDVFAWTYEELKIYDTQIIHHVILIKEGAKPFEKKLREFQPTLEPLIQKELRKLLDS